MDSVEKKYCIINDCNENNGISYCCFYCPEEKCPERCKKISSTSCKCLIIYTDKKKKF